MTGESVTIGALARARGIPRNTLWRRLLRLKATTSGQWLVRRGRLWWVNVPMLQAECPEYAQPMTESERIAELEARVHALEALALEEPQKSTRKNLEKKRAS